MRKLQIIVIAFIIISIPLMPFPAETSGLTGTGDMDELSLAHTAFEATGADLETVDIMLWAELGKPVRTEHDLEQLLKNVLGSMGPKRAAAPVIERESSYLAAKTEIRYPEGSILRATVQKNYFAAVLTLKNTEQSADKADKYVDNLVQTLSPLKNHRKIVQFTGTYAGKLSRPVEKELIRKVLQQVNAKKVAGIEDEQLISLTAFSPLSPAIVDVAGRSANLQLALRYHSYDDRTYISIGIPLLDGEY